MNILISRSSSQHTSLICVIGGIFLSVSVSLFDDSADSVAVFVPACLCHLRRNAIVLGPAFVVKCLSSLHSGCLT